MLRRKIERVKLVFGAFLILLLFTSALLTVMVVSNKNAQQDIRSRASGVASANVLNVKALGAKGNGVNDDAKIIQAAINSLSGTGGTIYFPPGTYMLGTSAGGVEQYPNGQPIQSALIVNKDNVVIQGDRNHTILKLMPKKKMRAISVTGKNVTIQNIIVDGNKQERNGSVPWPNGDVVDALVYTASNSKNVTVRNCEVRNGIEDGIGFWKSEDGRVENCSSHDNGTPQAGGSGISVSGSIRTKVLGNTSSKNTIGIWSSFGSNNIIIQNNMVKDNAQEGVIIGGFTVENGCGNNSGFTIAENTIEANGIRGFAGISIASAKNGTITKNKILDNYFVGIQIDDEGTIASSNWVIEQNVCSTTKEKRQQFGIRVLGKSENIIVKNNTCKYSDETTQKPLTTFPVYRLVNNQGFYFYTANAEEKDGAIKSYGYKLERVAFYAPTQKTGVLVEVYRLTNPGGSRLYTASVDEKNNALKIGYSLDGVAFYAYTTQKEKTLPVYRLHDGKSNFLYTMSEAEKESAVKTYGYTPDGVAFYLWQSQ